jgi:hypothetical protein
MFRQCRIAAEQKDGKVIIKRQKYHRPSVLQTQIDLGAMYDRMRQILTYVTNGKLRRSPIRSK